MAEVLKFLRYLVPFLLILCGFLAGFYFEKRVLIRLRKIANRTGWAVYDIILSSLHGITLLWFVIAGIFGASLTLPLNSAVLLLVEKSLLALLLGSATIAIARLAVGFVRLYGERGGDPSPLTSLFENLTKLAIYSIGILIILQSLGISITPLLTALGVGGVSIGLALQNTLSNLFSGLNIIMSKKVRPGDYIELESGEAGYVTDVAWRYTIVEEIPANLIVVPNAKIVSSILKNYSLPNKEMLLLLQVGVGYDSDLDRVEAVTLEVAKETLKQVEGGVSDYEPFIRYEDFGYFSMNFTVYLRIREYFDHLVVRHEFIKRLYKRYQLEGIEIPFPIKSVYVPNKKDEKYDSRRNFNAIRGTRT